MAGKLASKEHFVSRGNIVHNGKFQYPGEYRGHKHAIDIICPLHGLFRQSVRTHLAGHGCNKCSRENMPLGTGTPRLTDDEFLARVGKLYGGIYQYPDPYIRGDIKIRIICPIHGEFLKTPKKHMYGQGCPRCELERQYANQTLSGEEYFSRVSELHDYKYGYPGEYIGGRSTIEMVCPKHGLSRISADSHLYGKHGCAKCVHRISDPETAWLDSLSVPVRQYWVKVHQHKKQAVDGYDPETNTIYQFHGDFWHGNPNRYPDEFAWNPRLKNQMFWLHKRTLANDEAIRKLGYNLIVMWEWDWVNNPTPR